MQNGSAAMKKLKKIRTHCEALRENVSLCRLAMQKVSSAKEQLVILQNAASAELKRIWKVIRESAECASSGTFSAIERKKRG